MEHFIDAPEDAVAFPVLALRFPAEMLEPEDAENDTVLAVPLNDMLDPLEEEKAADSAVTLREIEEPLEVSAPSNFVFKPLPDIEAPLEVSTSNSPSFGEKAVGRVMLDPDDASNDMMSGDMTVIFAN